jgi:D-alanyl-D-alanine carboxypeptidase
VQQFATKSAFAAALALGSLAFVASPALADPMVPTVILDAATGEVLQSEEATRPWFPASTTKLMTAYVALREIEKGNVKFETPLVVSGHAAKQPPSKVGLKAGQEITLENALKILMVKSANDVSTVVAEGIGGSVPGFSAMMNREAARLGMRESHFVNPHGLHRDDHVTSVRDMALLARALLLEFPQYSELWSIGAVQLGTRRYANTNGLIGRYPGAMGMKTGFVCSSGFNLVSAAERNGRTLIAVVFGATSAADRTLKAAQLLDQGFSGGSFSLFGGSANSGRTLHNLSASSESRAPNRRAEICGRRGPPVSEEDSGSAIAFTTNNAPDRVDGPSMRVGLVGSSGQSTAVGQRVGNRIALGPRDNFDPVQVYIGRKPGSSEIARRPGGETPEPTAQAFAPEPKRTARGNPLALHNAAVTPGASAGIGRAKVAPVRPAAAASLANRGAPKATSPNAEPVKTQSAALQPATKVKADTARKAKAATSAKTQPSKKNAKTEPKA